MLRCAHVLRQQSQDLRPGLRARLHVRRRPRPARLRRGRLRAHRRAREAPRRAPLQPHHPQPAADRAGRHLLRGRAEDPRHHRRGRGRRRRRLAQPARLDPRRRPPRHRQAPDRPAHPRLPATSIPRSTCACASPTAALDITAEGLDVVFVLGTLEDSNLRVRPIADCRRVLAAAPAYLAAPRASRAPARTSSTSATTACCTATPAPASSSGPCSPPTAPAASRSRARSNPTTATC